MEPRAPPRRRARRGDRHRRLLNPTRAPPPAAGGQAAPLPAHGAVGGRPAPRPQDIALRAGAIPRLPARPASRARARVPLARAVRVHADAPALGLAARARCAQTPAQTGPRPAAARKAHTALPHRLQAHAHLKRLLPRTSTAQRRGRHRLDHRDHPARDRHRRRAERELDTIILGTGFHVTDMPIAAWVRGRDGRTLDDVWQGSSAGVPRHDRRGLPQPVHARRARTPASGTTRSCS